MTGLFTKHKLLGFVSGLVLMVAVLIGINAIHPQKAAAALTPCTNYPPLTNQYPTGITGVREEYGCTPSVSWLWLSDYSDINPATPLQTPNAVVRIFFSDAGIAASGGNLGNVTFDTEINGVGIAARWACTAVVNISITDAVGANQQATTMQKGGGCSNPVSPVLDLNAVSLITNIALYGSTYHYIDVVMTLTGSNTNAPIRVVASNLNAKTTFRDENATAGLGGLYVPPDVSSAGPPPPPNGCNAAGGSCQVGPDAGAFAVWTSDMGGGTHEKITYTFRFTTDCTVGIGQPKHIYLKWYDADEGVPATQPSEIGFYLVDDTTGAHVTVPDPYVGLLGGNDTYGEVGVDIIGGHQYRWIWSGVARNNGVQIYMPYSEITSDAGFSCAQPSGGALQSVDCQNNWIGWAADADNLGWGIRVHIFIETPAGVRTDLGYFVAGLPNAAANAAGFPGNHGFSIPAPPAYKFGPHTVYAYGTDINAVGVESGIENQLASSPQSFVSCPVPTPEVVCSPDANSAIVFNGAGQEYGVQGTLVTSIQNNTVGGSPPDINIGPVTYSAGPTLFAGSSVVPNPVPGGGTPAAINQPASFPAPDNYVVTATIPYTATLANGALFSNNLVCSGTIKIYSKSYFKAFGGDVWAGSDFGTSGCNANASIYAFSKGTGLASSGASAQFGVTALLNINEFYSASMRTAANIPHKGLTFSNTAGGTYGGAYGGGCKPVTDYFTQTRNTSPAPTGRPHLTVAVNSAPSGISQAILNSAGSIMTGTDLTIDNGDQIAVYVDGDVFLSRNISYDSAARTSDKDVPFFALIVRGNIYISPDVSRLDGLYVAQPGALGGGTIYTCAPSSGNLYPLSGAGNLYDSCKNNQLSVNGALIANRVKFLRTKNSLKDSISSPAEVPNFSTGAGTNASEVINFTPELYIAPSPLLDPKNNANTGTYDGITGLPPVF